MLMSTDPEVQQLSMAYARAVALTERLAFELDKTVVDLVEYVRPDKEVRDVRPQ